MENPENLTNTLLLVRAKRNQKTLVTKYIHFVQKQLYIQYFSISSLDWEFVLIWDPISVWLQPLPLRLGREINNDEWFKDSFSSNLSSQSSWISGSSLSVCKEKGKLYFISIRIWKAENLYCRGSHNCLNWFYLGYLCCSFSLLCHPASQK